MGEGFRVIHRPDLGKFLIRLAPGAYAFLRYELRNEKMYIIATYTPPEFRGRGIATYLTEYAVNWAKESGYKVVPQCAFTVAFFKKRKDLQHLLDEEYLRQAEANSA